MSKSKFMKNSLLYLLVLFMGTYLFGMDHTVTDNIEKTNSSDSEIESDYDKKQMYVLISTTDKYAIYFNAVAVNKSPKNATLIIGVYINNQNIKRKQYTINANSTITINDHIPVSLNKNDLLELKFKAPEVVKLETKKIDIINLELLEPKTKL